MWYSYPPLAKPSRHLPLSEISCQKSAIDTVKRERTKFPAHVVQRTYSGSQHAWDLERRDVEGGGIGGFLFLLQYRFKAVFWWHRDHHRGRRPCSKCSKQDWEIRMGEPWAQKLFSIQMIQWIHRHQILRILRLHLNLYL